MAFNMMEMTDMKKYFETSEGIVRAVDGIDISITQGETYGLVGESGSGKSTVAYTAIGLYKPTAGMISYKGDNIGMGFKNRGKKLKKDLQIVFQDPGSSLNSARTVRQILEVPLKVHNIVTEKNRIEKKIIELLDMVELPKNYMDKYPAMMGGGEKQMISIARALATNPSFIILDEPTSALDVSIQAKIINMLMKFQKELSLSYLFITHDLSLMSNVATKVAIMYLGKICERTETAEFFKKPLHPYTQMLLSSIPVITESEEKLKPKQIESRGEIPSPVNIPTGCSFHLRCPKKLEICSRVDPNIIEAENRHYVRCHLFNK